MKAALILLRRLFGRTPAPTHQLKPLPRPHLLALHIEQATERAIKPNPFPFAR